MKVIKILAAVSSMGLTLSSWAGEAINESMSAAGISVVNIENMRGKVTVIGTDEGQVSAKGELGEYAEQFVFEKSGNMLRIKVEVEERRSYNNGQGSEFTVRMPKNIRMNFEGFSTDIKLSHLTDHVDVKTVSGDIIAEQLTQNIDLNTISGDIDSKNLSGKIRLSTVSGSIDDSNSSGRIDLKSVSGNVKTKSSATEVSLKAVSGDIDFSLAQVDELVISVVSGDVEGSLSLNDNGDVKFSGVSADIELEFQDDVNADFRLHASAGGDIVNRITSEKAKRAKYGPSSKLAFTSGNGSASVRGSVVNGEIKVTRR